MEDFIDRVDAWQQSGIVHPLTCGKKSSHELLRGEIRDGKPILVCPTCGYIQTYIPNLPLPADIPSE